MHRKRTGAGGCGIGQLTLVEHALCPLDVSTSLRGGGYETEYFFSDKQRRRRKARVRIDGSRGLSPHDEFFLWGLLALVLSQPNATIDFYATPHYCLKQLGCLSRESKGGKNYARFRQALRRLALVRYQCDQFYDPLRREHRAVSFGFFSYSLPIEPNSSRAWRIVWDPLFFEVCQAAGSHLTFDLETYRTLDCASRRLFLLLKKVFWRRAVSPVFDVRHLAVNVLGYSGSRDIRKLKASVTQCAQQLLALKILALPVGLASVGRLFTKRGKGEYTIQFHRGDYFNQPHRTSVKSSLDDSPLCGPLRAIGFDDRAIRRILARFPGPTIAVWADVTLAAVERREPGFFHRSPQAFFMDSIQEAAGGRRTPPDWFRDLQREEQRRQADCARTARRKRDARESERRPASQSTPLVAKDRALFEHIMEEMLVQFRAAGQLPADAQRNAERFAQAHLQHSKAQRAAPTKPLPRRFLLP